MSMDANEKPIANQKDNKSSQLHNKFSDILKSQTPFPENTDNNYTLENYNSDLEIQTKHMLFRYKKPEDCSNLMDIVGSDNKENYVAGVLDWVPRYSDINRISQIIEMIPPRNGNEVKVADIAGNNGFLVKLLQDMISYRGETKANFDIVDPSEFAAAYLEENAYPPETGIKFIKKTSKEYASDPSNKVDIAICSWMLPDLNLRPDMEEIDPSVIINIRSVYPETGTPEAYSDSENYIEVAAWQGITRFGALDTVPDPETQIISPEEENIISVLVKKDLIPNYQDKIQNLSDSEGSPVYPWEHEVSPPIDNKIYSKTSELPSPAFTYA